ncbi:unnamed protein product [Protopolystoma xenopodis]|uniref:Uncharacterized protein n=1 Tax=Protopolystoma xenopodis TaxID=117903 RepID=A0A448X086_9PLAT|nr:unnamed protein product [Protopolystoma xenopodis]
MGENRDLAKRIAREIVSSMDDLSDSDSGFHLLLPGLCLESLGSLHEYSEYPHFCPPCVRTQLLCMLTFGSIRPS